MNREPTEDELERALRFVERARDTHPDNGALWLAEGLLYAELGQHEVAIDMFEEASRRPVWNCQPEMYRRVYELLFGEGILPLDAAIEAAGAGYRAGMSLDSDARWTIDRIGARAIREQDHVRFNRLLHAVAEMGECRWKGLHAVNRLRTWLVFSSGTAALAMSDKERYIADPLMVECFTGELEEEAFKDYASRIVGPELAYRLLPTREEARAYYESLGIVRFQYGPEHNWNIAMADVLGNFSLLGLAGCLSLAAFSISLVKSKQKFGDPKTSFRIRWRRVIWALPICIWLLRSALSHRYQPIGLSSGPSVDPPLLTASIVLGVVVGGVALWVFTLCRTRRGHANCIMLAASFTLACILVCSHYRAEVAEVSHAFARQPMTQEFQGGADG